MADATERPGGRRAAFGFIFACALMNSVSFGIMIPVLPNLIKAFAGGDTASASLWNTVFAVTWGVMQLFCGPVLGMLSDRIGRRPVLLISLFGLAVDFMFMAFAPTLGWLLVGRVLNGLTAASFSTANAYVADVTAPQDRAKTFGYNLTREQLDVLYDRFTTLADRKKGVTNDEILELIRTEIALPASMGR